MRRAAVKEEALVEIRARRRPLRGHCNQQQLVRLRSYRTLDGRGFHMGECNIYIYG